MHSTIWLLLVAGFAAKSRAEYNLRDLYTDDVNSHVLADNVVGAAKYSWLLSPLASMARHNPSHIKAIINNTLSNPMKANVSLFGGFNSGKPENEASQWTARSIIVKVEDNAWSEFHEEKPDPSTKDFKQSAVWVKVIAQALYKFGKSDGDPQRKLGDPKDKLSGGDLETAMHALSGYGDNNLRQFKDLVNNKNPKGLEDAILLSNATVTVAYVNSVKPDLGLIPNIDVLHLNKNLEALNSYCEVVEATRSDNGSVKEVVYRDVTKNAVTTVSWLDFKKKFEGIIQMDPV